MEKTTVAYRTWYLGQPPRPIKLQIPGWAGDPGYSEGCKPQPWHCKPFVDASTYGLELIYPFPEPCVVTGLDGGVRFDGNFPELEAALGMKHPFMAFAPDHYGYTSSLDIMTRPGTVTRVEPHPRFFTDRTGECPIAVAGHLETEWWSRIFFLAFKSPRPGEKHVFRQGEGYAQVLFVPRDVEYEVRPMTADEESVRKARDEGIAKNSKKICSHFYLDHLGHRFDNKYKVLSKVNRRAGADGVDGVLAGVKRPVKMKRIPMKRWVK